MTVIIRKLNFNNSALKFDDCLPGHTAASVLKYKLIKKNLSWVCLANKTNLYGNVCSVKHIQIFLHLNNYQNNYLTSV